MTLVARSEYESKPELTKKVRRKTRSLDGTLPHALARERKNPVHTETELHGRNDSACRKPK
jgi:hypothetical protein